MKLEKYKSKLALFFSVALILCSFACKKEKPVMVEVTGEIKVQGITTYQYGTHTISNSSMYYALKSDTYNLDNYLNQTVTVVGETIPGYPFNGGPYYLNVIEIK